MGVVEQSIMNRPIRLLILSFLNNTGEICQKQQHITAVYRWLLYIYNVL